MLFHKRFSYREIFDVEGNVHVCQIKICVDITAVCYGLIAILYWSDIYILKRRPLWKAAQKLSGSCSELIHAGFFLISWWQLIVRWSKRCVWVRETMHHGKPQE